jgi:TP901 family phage tail tape measure protein
MPDANKSYSVEVKVITNGEQKLTAMQRMIDQTRKRGEMLNRIKINPAVRLLDRVTGPMKKIEGNLRRVTSKTWNIAIDVKDKTGKVLDGITKKIGSVPTLLGAGALALGPAFLIGNSIGKAMDFEAQMSSIKSLLSNEEKALMPQIQDLAIKMGAATKYSALEAAQGMEELIKAGLTVKQVMEGGLEGALNLATAGDLDLAEAAEIMSTAMNTFSKDGLKASEAANILAGTANASATSVHELRYSLAAVGSVADGVGLSFKDTAAALGVFANAGLKGSDAGTSLKTFLSNLQPQTKQQIALFEKLNLLTKDGANLFFDQKGHIKNLADIAGLLHDRLKNLTDQQRSLYLEQMFGSDAVRAANILFKAGAEGVKDFTEQMMKVTALDVAREKMNNASGAVEQFRGAIETLQISAMMPVLPLITKLANKAADFVTDYTPQITKAMENMVNKARSYIHSHFLDNPEFKKLPDIKSKVLFVFDDIFATFQKWLNSGGQDQLNQVGSSLMNILAGVVEASAPRIAQAGLMIGSALGKAIISAFVNALSDSPWGALISGAIIGAGIGSVVPGLGTGVGTVVGAASGLTTYGLNKLVKSGSGENHTDQYPKPNLSGLGGSGTTSSNASWGFFGPAAIPHAKGGILTRPHLGLVAEAGPEAIIPLSSQMRGRALDLYAQVGNYLGVGTPQGSGGSGDLNVSIGGLSLYTNHNLDSDEFALQIGRKLVHELKKALENRS